MLTYFEDRGLPYQVTMSNGGIITITDDSELNLIMAAEEAYVNHKGVHRGKELIIGNA